EIAGLFDTVYVSFYKGLGGISGSILAGPPEVIAEARIWQRRHGGNLVQLYPFVLINRNALAKRLSRMDAYHARAVAIAEALTSVQQIEILPNPPHTNMMHLFLRGERERLQQAALRVAQETGVWLFGGLSPGPIPVYQRLELTVGEAAFDLTDEEIARLFRSL